jgi:hypothetical protein
LAAALSGCASWQPAESTPLLRLSPASLGRELAVVQRMEVEAQGQVRVFETVLEVDPDGLRLAVLQMGQTIARLSWDGQTLMQSLAPGWPSVVSAENVLSDLQYVWWPQPQVQGALPTGWMLLSRADGRELWHGDAVVFDMRAVRPGVIELRHRERGYVVRLQTQGAQPDFGTP